MAACAIFIGALYVWILPRFRAGRTETAKAPLALEAPSAQGQSQRHPLAKHLEISGVRLGEGKNGMLRLRFVVVNHSGAELPDLKAEAVIASAERALFRVPVTLASMRPYEVRELETNVRTELKSYELPDWQMIRPSLVVLADRNP